SSIQGLLSWHEDTKFMLIDHEKRLPFLDSLFLLKDERFTESIFINSSKLTNKKPRFPNVVFYGNI
ncbi:hypothetical protein K8089_03665, partial [Aequorivita sp. F47161]